MIWSRSRIVWARKSTSSKIVGSGMKVMVTPVRARGAGPVIFNLPWGLPPFLKTSWWWSPFAVDFQDQLLGECVHDRDTDAVQAPGDLVAFATELSSGVQHRQHDLGCGFAGVLGMFLDRDTSAVVHDPTAPVREDGHVDARAVAGHRLVDGVVHDLPDEVVQARRSGGADVHTGSHANRLEAFKNGDVTRLVARRSLGLLRPRRIPFDKKFRRVSRWSTSTFRHQYPTRLACHAQTAEPQYLSLFRPSFRGSRVPCAETSEPGRPSGANPRKIVSRSSVILCANAPDGTVINSTPFFTNSGRQCSASTGSTTSGHSRRTSSMSRRSTFRSRPAMMSSSSSRGFGLSWRRLTRAPW